MHFLHYEKLRSTRTLDLLGMWPVCACSAQGADAGNVWCLLRNTQVLNNHGLGAIHHGTKESPSQGSSFSSLFLWISFFFKSIGKDWWVSSRRNFLLRLFNKTPFRIWILLLLTVSSGQYSEWRPLQSLGTVVGLLCEQEPGMHFMCWSWVLMLVCWATLPCLAAV